MRQDVMTGEQVRFWKEVVKLIYLQKSSVTGFYHEIKNGISL
jgi:hypothetical protein